MNLDNMKAKAIKELLQHLLDRLDELDEEDYFGSEGWKHFFGLEEE